MRTCRICQMTVFHLDSSTEPKNALASYSFFAPRPRCQHRGMTHRGATLIGRDRELEILARFLQHAAADGGAFVLVGEPGAGKTALLEAAADAAEEAGTGVLRAAGAEFEADLAYSGLHPGLLPVFGQFERLSDP